ncbi:MAG: thiamine pyrophosphate-binding protein [Oscillospiraceae bacterium]
MRGADILVKMLIDHGVTHIFGVPGDTSMAFHDAIGVVEVPSGGGALYVVPGVSEANMSNIPLLCLASEITMSSEEMCALTDCNQEALFASASKWNTKVRLSSKLPQMIRKAIRTATSGTPGATVLSLPENLLRDAFDGKESDVYGCEQDGRWQQLQNMPTIERAQEIYDVIRKAKKPVILAGGGVHLANAYQELEELAKGLNVPVVTSIDGKGSVAETEYYSLGVVGANGGSAPANEVVMQADMILVLGCKMDKVTTMGEKLIPSDAVIVQVDVDEMILANVLRVKYPVMCDIKGFLQQLNAVHSHSELPPQHNKDWMAFVEKQRKAKEAFIQKDYSRTAPYGVVSAKIFECLEKITDEKTVFCGDAGTPTPYISSYLKQKVAGKNTVIPRAHGALGYAIGASIGAQVARPDHKVICMVGDSSFGMAMGELETAKRVGLPIVFINFQNNCYGWIKTIQRLYYEENYFGVDFSPIDAVKIAEGFGIKGKNITCNQEIETVLKWALELGEPVMINVITEKHENFIPPVYQWEKDAAVTFTDREKLVY